MSSTETTADHLPERLPPVEILELQTASKRLWARLLGGDDNPRIRAVIDMWTRSYSPYPATCQG
ncbi:hypothetical protein ACWCOW_17485 [Streptomyces sp. NPDC001939]